MSDAKSPSLKERAHQLQAMKHEDLVIHCMHLEREVRFVIAKLVNFSNLTAPALQQQLREAMRLPGEEE